MNVKVILPKAIVEISGLDRNYFDEPVANEKHIFRYSVDLNTIHQLYVYSDLASYTFIGDVTAPILRVLPFESKRKTITYIKNLSMYTMYQSRVGHRLGAH